MKPGASSIPQPVVFARPFRRQWPHLHYRWIVVCMRTTLDLNAELLQRAQELTQLPSKTAVLHAGLKTLIANAAADRLSRLGGSQPDFKLAKRHRAARAR